MRNNLYYFFIEFHLFLDRFIQTARSREITAFGENRDVYSPGRTWFLQASSSRSETQGDLQVDRRHRSCAHATIFSCGESR